MQWAIMAVSQPGRCVLAATLVYPQCQNTLVGLGCSEYEAGPSTLSLCQGYNNFDFDKVMETT